VARARCGTDLSTRSDQADLPPVSGGGDVGKSVDLLTAEAEQDTWRVVEVFSRTGLPFEVDLSWSSGSGSGAGAQITVARSARICVLARSLRVQAANLAAVLNRVGVTVADGFAPTRNQWEVRGDVDEGLDLEARVPPFAETCRVDIGDLATVPETLIRVFDALGNVRGAYNAALQPSVGIPVGGASRVLVTHFQSLTKARVVFHLSL
jgi:hypothetical protein